MEKTIKRAVLRGGSSHIRTEATPVDARALAASWRRPYSSVQWAWVRALDVQPSDSWCGGKLTKRQRRASREIREAMGQRFGVRGL